MSTPPPPSVIAAFGLAGTPLPLPGGRNLCYRISSTVFRPCDDPSESQWLSELSAALLERSPTHYRLAAPLPALSDSAQFVVSNWTASSLVTGSPSTTHFEALFKAADTLHGDLAEQVKEKPRAVQERVTNRFDEADKVTWGEKELSEVKRVNEEMLGELQPVLDQLKAAMQALPLPEDEEDALMTKQLVHMDLLGNVLFEEGKPPGIIDLSFYWRPAAYARAIVVVDGLAWGGCGRELVGLFLQWPGGGEMKRDVGVHLLMRALYWRYLTFAINPDLEWVRANLPRADYVGAAKIICGLIEK